jgi:hypothetical protein
MPFIWQRSNEQIIKDKLMGKKESKFCANNLMPYNYNVLDDINVFNLKMVSSLKQTNTFKKCIRLAK